MSNTMVQDEVCYRGSIYNASITPHPPDNNKLAKLAVATTMMIFAEKQVGFLEDLSKTLFKMEYFPCLSFLTNQLINDVGESHCMNM